MTTLKFATYSNPQEWLSIAPRWDELWMRSALTLPIERAATLAHFWEGFGKNSRLTILTVELNGQLLGALPLTDVRWGGCITAGGQFCNAWCPSGDLLLDENSNVDTTAVLQTLLRGMNSQSWPLYVLRATYPESSRWQRFLEVARELGFSADVSARYRVNSIPVRGTWESYTQTWSKTHRSGLARNRKKLEAIGDVRLVRHARLMPHEVEPFLRRGFEIEDRGWKGAGGTSVLRTPGMFEFYLQQAQQLAEWQQLEIAFLELSGRPIAFEYLMRGKRTLHSFKVAYDEEFGKFGAGQMLMGELLRASFENRDIDAYDCMGPESDATRKWRGTSYAVGQILLAPKKVLGRAILFAYQQWRKKSSRPQSVTEGTVARDVAAETQEPDAPDNRNQARNDQAIGGNLKQPAASPQA